MLDLVVIILLFIFGAIGYKRGLLDAILSLLGSVGSLILAFIVYPVVNMVLKLTPLYTGINEWVTEKVGNINFGTGVQTQGNAITQQITWLPQFMNEQLVRNNNTEVYELLGVKNIVDYVSLSITNIIIAMVALLITWVLLKVILTGSLRTIGKMIAKLPVISSLNRLGGLVLGIIKGLLTLWIIGLMIPLVMTIPSYEMIGNYIEASILTKWLYENNLVIMVFNQLFKI